MYYSSAPHGIEFYSQIIIVISQCGFVTRDRVLKTLVSSAARIGNDFCCLFLSHFSQVFFILSFAKKVTMKAFVIAKSYATNLDAFFR